MASLLQFVHILSTALVIFTFSAASNPRPQPYVVYMGSSSNYNKLDSDAAKLSHLQLLSSIIPREERDRLSIQHSYQHSFSGFSAMLTEDEASILSAHSKVVSVFPDPVLKLHTTRSWDFLEQQSKIRLNYHLDQISSDIIVGVIDTGIWPELPSFSDRGVGKIPSRWKGECMEGPNFKKSNCNRKIIGARFYDDFDLSTKPLGNKPNKRQGSPRDAVGHGTHTASIVAGAAVANASYYGLARGKAKGGVPSARIAAYKACSTDGCSGSTILKAIEDALSDGVDIISISIGQSSVFQPDFLSDPIAIGAFHAAEKGAMVICSAGNEGPEPYTVVNSAPWLFTVAASTVDRDLQSIVILGNKRSYQGTAINFSPLNSSKAYPLAFGENVAARFVSPSDARNCAPGSLDRIKVAGKIVICLNDNPTISRMIKKLVVEDAKAKGLILIDEEKRSSLLDSGIFPFTEVGKLSGSPILNYLNSTKNPTATILPTFEVPNFKPAPIIADFSSRGPGSLTEDILKPDIVAPGVAILAAMIPKSNIGDLLPGMKPSSFGIRSGTSMACPHVTGAMAFVKSIHPNWSYSMIKSALMTTATTSNNLGKPITNTSNYNGNPHEMGVGEISPLGALHPGLVFETTTKDYLRFLCYYGYKEKAIRSMSNRNFCCPRNSAKELISNVNYPSISIGELDRSQGAKRVKRIVTNVGPPNATFFSSLRAPPGLTVKVIPKKLSFTTSVKKLLLKVSFDSKYASKGYNYGAILLFDGSHTVHITFVVNVV
ncbi:CO(2)-response secreted protease-like [Coffea arabica]|uniref:CO(2)-response secreted protease-like n=1 Tax=Coffea arabica TaxID=13443 RepID=A0A6P6VZC5_COFAR|nr:CO(2)-response secreted protease-like [Coffea arabica]